MDDGTGGRTAFRRWVNGLPRPVRWLLAGLFVVVYYVVAVLVLSLIHHGQVDWGQPLPGLVGGFGGAFGALWWRTRRMGGREKAREYEAALKTGRLPTDADPSAWRSVLAREERAGRRTAVFAYAFFGLVAAVVLVLGVVRSSGLGWPFLVGVALLLAVGGSVAWAVRLQRRRIQRLRNQLPQDPIAAP